MEMERSGGAEPPLKRQAVAPEPPPPIQERQEPPAEVTPFTRQWWDSVRRGQIQPPRVARDYAQMLMDWGFIVLPVFNANRIEAEHRAFNEALYSLPEYSKRGPSSIYASRRDWPNDLVGQGGPGLFQGEVHWAKGGFGALGTASSFHNPFVRRIRQGAHGLMHQVAKNMRRLMVAGGAEQAPSRFEQVVDRMSVRRPKATIKAESWHRDTTPDKFTQPGDLIYGGWINFDQPGDAAQRLSVFPRSHRLLPAPLRATGSQGAAGPQASGAAAGFSAATKDQAAQLDALKEQVLRDTNGKGWYVEVPPGHMLVFQQEMVHEVLGGRGGGNSPLPSYRLFTAWRLTDDTQPFLPNQFNVQTLDVPRLKSNQPVEMWPQANWRPPAWDNLQEWSRRTFKPEYLEQRPILSGSHQGESKQVVPRRMYNLNDVSLKAQARNLKETMERLGEPVPDIVIDILRLPPSQWRDYWTEQDLIDYGFWPNDVYFPPYSRAEMDLLRPQVLPP